MTAFAEAVHVISDPRVGPPLVVRTDKEYLIGRPPSVKQRAFLNAGEREQLYGGSKSGGKTAALCAKIIAVGCAVPGNRIGLFRKDLTDLKGSTLVTFFRMCPPELILGHHRTDHIIRLKTGGIPTEIIYGGLGDIHEVESAKGKEFGAIAIDEPSEIELETYLQLLAQLRWRLPDGSCPPYQAWLGSNPEPGWLEDHFGHLIQEANPERPVVSDGQRVYIQALPRDNPYLPTHWEALLRNQKDIPVAWIKKYLEGSWEASEGQVYKEFQREVHCIAVPPPEFLSRLTLLAALDHATTGTTAMVIDGIDADGNVFALGSYYQKNRLISEHAKEMCRLADYWINACGKKLPEKPLDRTIHPSFQLFDYVLIDPSTQAKTLQNRQELYSYQDEYRRNGIPTVAAHNAVEVGINLMKEYLHIKPTHIHPLTNKRPSPSFFIVADNNREGIRELVSWKRTITQRGALQYVGPDHWLDCQRYILMSRPEPPRFTAKDILSMDTHAQKAHRAMDRWSATFGKPEADNQWFPGGSGNSNLWFPRPN